MIEESSCDILLDEFDGMSCEIFKNQIKNKNKNSIGQRYNDEIKKFALTLNYYSPKTYKYCRLVNNVYIIEYVIIISLSIIS